MRANRRRLIVFASVLCAACAVGLAYDFTRPAQYRATAKLQISTARYAPPEELRPAAGPADFSGRQRQFLTEVQALSGRALVEQAARRLRDAGQDLSALGAQPVAALQGTLRASPVPGTHVVELAATGANPQQPARFLEALIEAYMAQAADAFRAHWETLGTYSENEVRRLRAAVAAKRLAANSFGARYNVATPQHEENEAVAQVQHIGKALQTASARVSVAEGKLSALRQAVGGGTAMDGARDDPALADLERRAAQQRAELHDLLRMYTTKYLALDPNTRALAARLADLERQIRTRRAASQQLALARAEEELTRALQAERRLRAQLAEGRRDAAQVAARAEQYRELQSELSDLEKAYRDALQRKARLEAEERARAPSVQVLERPASVPTPWRPRYWRDAGFVGAGALLLSLIAMAIVELFSRPEPQPAFVLAQPVIAGGRWREIAHPIGRQAVFPALGAPSQSPLDNATASPRELSPEEVQALLRAADAHTRLAALLVLSGISVAEAAQLRWTDVDGENRLVHVGGEFARTVQLYGAAAQVLAAGGAPAAPVLQGLKGQAAGLEFLSTRLLYAAHDAGLERAHEVTMEALRYTYAAFLMRQGVRFAELGKRVGQLPGEALAAYGTLAPGDGRVARESVNYVFPGLENAGAW